MVQNDFSWQSGKNIQIAGREWQPEGTVRAVIVLIHGLGEHIGRYQHVADMFCSNGYAVLGADHPGHGLSGGKRGHVDSYEDFMQEIDHLLAEAETRYPGKPQVLYGHSLGGSLVLYYALLRRPAIAGVISTGPAIAPANTSKALQKVAKVLSAIVPTMTINNGLVLEGLSHDKNVVAAYQKDPLNHPDISFRLGYELIANGDWILQHAGEFSLPLLLMQGEADKLVSPAATREFASRLTGNQVYKEWPGGYHELHNEPYKDQVFQVMLDWLKQLLDNSAKLQVTTIPA